MKNKLFLQTKKILTPLSDSLPRREEQYPLGGVGNNSFAKQTDTCHPELVSGSYHRNSCKMLKQVQHDKAAFTLAEVFHPAEQSRKIASRIILAVAGVTSRSNSRAGFAIAHTAPYRKFGFTLAEVLITLGIIGVVAALTMPSLIANYQKKQTVAKLQKDIATIQQAIKMSEAFNGETVNWSLPNISLKNNAQVFGNTYLFPYLKTIKTSIPTSEDCWADTKTIAGNQAIDYKVSDFGQYGGCAVLSNGSSIYFWTNGTRAEGDTHDLHAQISIDINGHKKGPNMLGKDVFVTYLSINDGKIVTNSSGSSRDELISETYSHSCNKNNQSNYAGLGCASLIAKDSWQISKDYPW